MSVNQGAQTRLQKCLRESEISPRATLKLTSRVTGLLTIDNLTNRDYMEPIGYQPLQRTIRAGIRVGF